jgi:hypothetical protein
MMATPFATGTKVTAERTETQIRSTLRKFGAAKYAYYEDDGHIGFSFEMQDRRVRIVIDLPDPDADEFAFYTAGNQHHTRQETRSEASKLQLWQKECDRRWRALLLSIKAKLVTVSEGIRTFEQEFFYDIVLPNNQTVGEYVAPQVEQAYLTGKLPPLLPGLGETGHKKRTS